MTPMSPSATKRVRNDPAMTKSARKRLQEARELLDDYK